MDIKIELVILPVTDVDRAKAFYVDQVGFHADFDQRVNENLRFVQLTPAGSACSIAFGEGLTDAAPGSVKGLQAVVADADEAHAELTAKGVPVTDVDDLAWGRFVISPTRTGTPGRCSRCPSGRTAVSGRSPR